MNIHQILQTYWGYTSFRPLQEEIIQSVLDGKDTLALLPTGGGKSICFQVPALHKEGICIVVSPLIALMKDQVEGLLRKEIAAAAIHSGMSARIIDYTLDNAIYGKYKFLYVSPERLQSDLFIERLKKMPVNLLAVDEAHCISQWGYDFRPSYLSIADIRTHIPSVPVLALTATATPNVVTDIQEKLLFTTNNLFKKSFERTNLSYSVLYEDAKLTRLCRILTRVPGSSVVYVRNRRKTKEIAEYLRAKQFSADYYHAGLSHDIRAQKQEEWIQGRNRIIVSTNAFGMGIDKPDVRTVVHIDLPDSIEAYFQEAGRAGRDGKKAYAVLLFNHADKIQSEKKIQDSYPTLYEIKLVYDALGNFFQIAVGAGNEQCCDFDISSFCNRYHFSPTKVWHALTLLEQSNLIALSSGVGQYSQFRFSCSKEEIYKFEVEHADYEPIIKYLLRNYPNVSSSFVSIHEEKIAAHFQKKPAHIQRIFQLLDTIKIGQYEPARRSPFIQYLQPRLDIKNLLLDEAYIQQRIEHYHTCLSSMLHYATQKNQCRSNILLEYFGEIRSDRCGMCDYCVGRNKMELSDVELQTISTFIEKELATPNSIHYIVKVANTKHEEQKLLHVVQWLIDLGKIRKTEENKLIWTD